MSDKMKPERNPFKACAGLALTLLGWGVLLTLVALWAGGARIHWAPVAVILVIVLNLLLTGPYWMDKHGRE